MRAEPLADTQPGRPVIARRRGCRSTPCLLVLFAVVMVPVFVIGLGLLFYLVFPPPQMDILIIGVDGRGGEGLVSRADSISLLGVDPARLRVSLLSIPRDVFIEVPGYGPQRINTVNALGEQASAGGGPPLLGQGIAQTFGVTPERYVRLDFEAFVSLVDAVGGVVVDVPRVIEDYAYPTDDGGVKQIRFDPGLQVMDGERALMYARTRHADDDYRRAERQQQVISALAARLVNPLRWPAALAALNRAVDTDLMAWDMIQLAPPLLLSRGRFDTLVLNRDYLVGTADGYAVPNLQAVLPWLTERFE